jgi:hypothetical protein
MEGESTPIEELQPNMQDTIPCQQYTSSKNFSYSYSFFNISANVIFLELDSIKKASQIGGLLFYVIK